ncbi:MAG: S49 family peptidase [Pseudomonadota bacterium]
MSKLFDLLRPVLPKKYREKPVVIPTIRLSGAIMAGQGGFRPPLSLATSAAMIEKAFSFKDAPAVAILINSPGGSPVQANLIYKRIRALAEEKSKKVIVAVEDVAASGGYMIAVAGDEIIADPSSIVGSIGVISAGFGFTGLIDKIGVDRRVYTSGKNKMILDPFQPEKTDDIDYLKGLQEEIHETFIDLVKERRGDVLNGEEDDLFSGRFWTGQTGQQLGLVDRIGDLRTLMRERYGESVKLRLISGERGFFRRGMFGGRVYTAVANPDFAAIGAGVADRLLESVEERALWARFGL